MGTSINELTFRPEEVGIHFNALDGIQHLALYNIKHFFPYGSVNCTKTQLSAGMINFRESLDIWTEPNFE